MMVLADEQEAKRVIQGLLQAGIIIRPLAAFGLSHCVRISTGMMKTTGDVSKR